MRPEIHYFGAGPALIPSEVIEQSAADLVAYKSNAIGIGEISHRSKDGVALVNAAKESITKLYNIPDTHEVFFIQGGGTGGFAAVFYNMMAAFAAKHHRKGKADYIVTGSWSQKAAAEASRLGGPDSVNIVANPKKSTGQYGSIPDPATWTFTPASESAYVYYCDNETVHGVEFPSVPQVPEGVELVADMSSNFLSKQLDVSKFGLIFGGAQKNIGIAGISLYIIKKSLLDRLSDEEYRELGLPLTPAFIDFSLAVSQNSLYHTIPLVPLDVTNHYADYLLAKGGLERQEQESDRKAAKVYAAIDKFPTVYRKLVDPACRSRMNVVFEVEDDRLKEFLDKAGAKGLQGLAGHRSVGGVRVSNYNAVSEHSIDLLVDFMAEFAGH